MSKWRALPRRVSRRQMLVGACALPVIYRGSSCEQEQQRSYCEAWLNADDSIGLLTLRWSEAESQTFASATADPKFTDFMQSLDSEIVRKDRERSLYLTQILGTEALTDQEAVNRLLVASRLLEGEGGDEYQLVTSAIRRLGRCLEPTAQWLDGSVYAKP